MGHMYKRGEVAGHMARMETCFSIARVNVQERFFFCLHGSARVCSSHHFGRVW
jgi:hypothetical protein